MKYKKICKCCGKEFETNSPQKLYCNGEHWLPCPICGKPVKKTDRDFTRPPKCCSSKCSHELVKQKMKTRKCILCGKEFKPNSGVNLICSDRHFRKCTICGKEFEIGTHNLETKTCSKECQWKLTRRTCFENNGAPYPMQTVVGQKHFQEAMQSKYGHKHALQVEKFKNKAADTTMERYGVPYYCLTQDCVDKQTEKSGIISDINVKFGEKLKIYGIPYKMEKRVETRSYDFEILEKNILIEINPTYTHSTVGTRYEGLAKSYHQDKSKLANQHGYHCIHIWDWDDSDKIIEMLVPKTRIYARNCVLAEIDYRKANTFLDSNHLQGRCRGQLKCFGLYIGTELIQVMTFGKPRYDKKYQWELLRLCTKSDMQVVGGASKLFKHAVKQLKPESIISYCDAAKFTGKVYTEIGMKFVRQTPPQEIWSRKTECITANLLRQRGYDQLFKTNYGKGTSNEQLMLENGWLPVADCGQMVFEYRSND